MWKKLGRNLLTLENQALETLKLYKIKVEKFGLVESIWEEVQIKDKKYQWKTDRSCIHLICR